MEITKEQMQQRRALAETERQSHLANANAAAGVVADCDYWLGVLTQNSPLVEKEASDGPSSSEL